MIVLGERPDRALATHHSQPLPVARAAAAHRAPRRWRGSRRRESRNRRWRRGGPRAVARARPGPARGGAVAPAPAAGAREALGRRRAHLCRRSSAGPSSASCTGWRHGSTTWSASASRARACYYTDFAAACRRGREPRVPVRAGSRARRSARPRQPTGAQSAPGGRAPPCCPTIGLPPAECHERSGYPRIHRGPGFDPGDPLQGCLVRGLDPAPSRRWNLFAQQPVPFVG